MTLSRSQRVLSHAALGFCLLLTTVYGIRQMFVAEYVEVCSTRYNVMTTFPKLETEAEAARRQLNRDELAATFGLSSWGVIENASVETASGLGNRSVIEARIPAGSYGPRARLPQKGGISFRWRHGRPEAIHAACLSYSLFLPQAFRFHEGGKLPGLFGKSRAPVEKAGSAADSFSSRLGWGPGGVVGLAALAPRPQLSGPLALNQGGWSLPLGQWLHFEQEVVLNTPGEADGIMRVWVNGEMLLDNREMSYRKTKDLLIDGVTADLYYDAEASQPAPANTFLRITPFDLRWN